MHSNVLDGRSFSKADCVSDHYLVVAKVRERQAVKDENGDLLADPQNILNRWKNYFSQFLNVHNVSDVRQIKVLMAEPLVPGPSRLEI
jgi:hypothetical protein